jgi:hypothetical protein
VMLFSPAEAPSGNDKVHKTKAQTVNIGTKCSFFNNIPPTD